MTAAFPRSLPEFVRMFPDDSACGLYLEQVRWPDGFVCPSCGERGEAIRFAASPTRRRCRVCRHDASLTAGTVMHRSHSPLTQWFWAAYLVATQTYGMSAVQFQRQIGIKRYETAFQMLHKLRAGMVRPNVDRIGGKDVRIEMDETLVGGETRGEGKGVHHKIYVVGAVEVRERPPLAPGKTPTKAMLRRAGKYAGRLRLRVIESRQHGPLLDFARESIAPGSRVTTDDWGGYDRLAEECGVYHTQIAERGDPAMAEQHLPLIHLVFSNLKTWVLGTHHSVSDQHMQAYLNEYIFRFNRRFYPFNGFRSLLGLAMQNESASYDELYSGHHKHPVAAGEFALT